MWRTTDGQLIEADKDAFLITTSNFRWFVDHDRQFILEQMFWHGAKSVWVAVPEVEKGVVNSPEHKQEKIALDGSDPSYKVFTEKVALPFCIKWVSGPNYARAFLCMQDAGPDVTPFAEVSFEQAHMFKSALLALVLKLV